MNVLATLEHRFRRTPCGKVWTQTMFAYPFMTGFLQVFDSVTVAARVEDVPSVPPDWKRADGPGVSFAPVPYYVGPWQYLGKFLRVGRALRGALGPTDAVVLRVPSVLGGRLAPELIRRGRPFGLDVVGDPYDVLGPGSVRVKFRPFFRWLLTRQLREQCAHACGVSYVTREALQRRYPARGYSTSRSDVGLTDESFAAAPRPFSDGKYPLTLVTVATLAQLYKAPEVLLDAVAACVGAGLDIRLVVVGDGKHRAELEARAVALGIAGRVDFRGQLAAGAAVRAELDRADLFVLPSRQEGLPRAMLEAMARALPCVGSTVGGIPELLPPEDMVPPGDAAALAAKIREVITNPGRMAAMSARNLERAREYHADLMLKQRVEFYRYVRERTEEWLRSRGKARRAG
ncbi:MAG TPA: glycosyltransferase family 4 protein [Gemmataceae bacterium]|nr:glycosyltransferase family 4 protein [Gemmataceae bacterium]